MIHGVAAAIERHLFVVDPICLGDRGNRRRIAGEAPNMRIEVRNIILHDRRRIALRIDSNEQGARAIGVRTKRPQYLGHFEQRGGAYVGTMRKAEENKKWMTLQILIADGASILVR